MNTRGYAGITGLIVAAGLGLATALSASSCQHQQTMSDSSQSMRSQMRAQDGSPDAEELWSFLEDAEYEHWAPWEGQDGKFYEGTRPHGAQLKVYINRTVAADWENPPHESIIVKENYSPQKELAAITVMKRVEGYDPENNDWFWVKYDGEGDVMTQGGNRIAGKVQSCIACHRNAGGDDYIFTNDE